MQALIPQQHWEDCFPRQDVGFPEFFLENPSRVIAAVKQNCCFQRDGVLNPKHVAPKLGLMRALQVFRVYAVHPTRGTFTTLP